MSTTDEYARCIGLSRPVARPTTRLAFDSAHRLQKHEPEWAELSGVTAFNELGFDGTGETVAVLDTGIERATPVLRENWTGGVSTIPGDSWLLRRGERWDSFFHGTATAGVVAQAMPRVRLLALKCFHQRRLDNHASWWVSAIEWLHRWQARHEVWGVVVNVSMGLTPDDAPRGSVAWEQAWADVRALEKVIKRSVEEYGNVYCAAASNDGERGSPPAYPAAFDGLVFAVGSVRLTRIDGRFVVEPSAFSNTNAYVDFVCPGEDVWTFLPTRTARLFRRTYARALRAGSVHVEPARCAGRRQWLVELDGTSFASPAFAALVAGLMQQYKQEHGGQRPTITELGRLLIERSKRFTDPTGRTWLMPTLLPGGATSLNTLDWD